MFGGLSKLMFGGLSGSTHLQPDSNPFNSWVKWAGL